MSSVGEASDQSGTSNTELDVAALREELPVTRDSIYLNNAATSPIPVRVRDAMVNAIDERLYGG